MRRDELSNLVALLSMREMVVRVNVGRVQSLISRNKLADQLTSVDISDWGPDIRHSSADIYVRVSHLPFTCLPPVSTIIAQTHYYTVVLLLIISWLWLHFSCLFTLFQSRRRH